MWIPLMDSVWKGESVSGNVGNKELPTLGKKSRIAKGWGAALIAKHLGCATLQAETLVGFQQMLNPRC